MSRYSTSFKQSVVDCYVEGKYGAGTVGLRFGVDHSTVRKWVASYQVHGAAGLSKKFSRYDARFKLSVLELMWKDGMSYRQTAALFDIRHAGCLSDWERRFENGGIEALSPRRRGRPRSMSKPPPRPTPGAPDPAAPDPAPQPHAIQTDNTKT